MMNLIGNCCISNFLLRMWGFGNTNPFTWIDMNFDSFYNLLTDYENINWEDIELTHRQHPYNKGQEVFELTIDKKIKLTYIHMIYDPNAKQPTIRECDVHYCKIWEYIVLKYREHVKKMLDSKNQPMFVIEWEHLDYDEKAFSKMYNLPELKYKVAVITYNTKLSDLPPKENLLVIYDPHGRGGGYKGAGNRFPRWYAQVYSDKIKNFMSK